MKTRARQAEVRELTRGGGGSLPPRGGVNKVSAGRWTQSEK